MYSRFRGHVGSSSRVHSTAQHSPTLVKTMLAAQLLVHSVVGALCSSGIVSRASDEGSFVEETEVEAVEEDVGYANEYAAFAGDEEADVESRDDDTDSLVEVAL